MAQAKRKSAKVIPMRNMKPIEWDSVHVVCSLLQREISTAMRNGTKLNHIASRCNIGHTTVSRIGYGETKAPRAQTCLTLLYYFGYRVHIS